MAKDSLKDKTVRGVGWSAMDNAIQYSVSFIVSIVLARLLSPDDYGLLGIIAIFSAICTALINGGFTSALIRRKNVSEEDYNTTFFVNLCMSILLYSILFFCSVFIARFFGRDELVSLTRVSSLGIIIGAFAIVQQTRLTKNIDFKTQTKITVVASATSGLIGIVMAILGFGVWSLVAQNLTSLLCRTILLWFFNRWIPRLRFSVKSFKELFGFGWKMMVSGLLDTVWKELYQVIVGKFYSPAALGQYTRSKQFAQLFSSNLTNVIQRVTYPVLSTIQDDRSRMVGAYRHIIRTTMFITAICLFSLSAISEPLLYCLIGPRWHDAAIYLPLICISNSLYPLHAINLNMLQVQGRSDLFLVLEIIKKIIGIGPLIVGIYMGIIPMLYINLITGIIAFILNSFYSGKYIGYSTWMQIKDITPSYLIAFVISIPVWLLKYLPVSYWIILPVQIVLCCLLIPVVCRLSRMREYDEVKSLLLSFINNIRRKVNLSERGF